MTPQIRIKRVRENAVIPTYQTKGASGLDLHSCAQMTFHAGETMRVPIGIAFEIPDGYEGQVRLRSSVGAIGFIQPNAPATIDSDYRGEVWVLLHLLSGLPWKTIESGDRIAQLVIAPIERVELVEADRLSDTERGVHGFGSTGR